MGSITVVTGPNEGDYYPLGKRVTIVGRDEAASVQILDDRISRKHLQVRWDANEQRYHLIDMKSSNGTFIQGRQVSDDVPLEDGDIIELGQSKIMFSTKEFDDRESAMNYYKKRGERGKSTLLSER
jgi:pSer/pThr/pTyr-binding forkhead associated (FHA) protein